MGDELYPEGMGLPGTRWSKVEAAAEPESYEGLAALDTLLTLYRPYLLSHLRHKFQLPTEDAEDLFQSFVQHKILEQNMFAQADRKRGRFRNYIFSVLNRFAISELRRQAAQKRCALHHTLPLDAVPEEALMAEPTDPSHQDFGWAQVVIAGALLNMQQECARSERPETWQIFLLRELAPRLTGAHAIPYEDVIETLRLDSPADAFNLLNTAKRMFRREVFDVLDDFAEDEEEVREEIEHLRRYLDRMARRN